MTLELTDPLIAEVDRRLRAVLEAAGAVVVVVPHSASDEAWRELFPLLDGVVLTGGFDVDPAAYGAEPHPLSRPGHHGQDVTDLGLARACLETGKPVVGVCRGSQVLNVAAGGTLIQDIPSQLGSPIAHSSDWLALRETTPGPGHDVELAGGTRLGEWLGRRRHVNSFHHQAVDRIGEGLAVAARAPDGVVEAFEGTGERFVVGLQWHVEWHLEGERESRVPFEELVRRARER